jgi:hypothetical protein
MSTLPEGYSPESCHWCYQGDMLVGEVSPHRQEWCVQCGTVRVLFAQLGWSYQVSDLARKHPCTGKGAFLSEVPTRALPPLRTKRLGRGLKDLIAQNPIANYRGLFPVPKKED